MRECKNLMHPLNNNKTELFRDGWTILKNIFSIREVEEIRKKAKSRESIESINSDILTNPALGNIVYDDRIISSVEYLLDGPLTYFGDGRLLIETVNGRKGGSFHRDNPDRFEPNGPDWKSNYDVVRIGIYLEDHKFNSEGLGLFSGSNRNPTFLPKRLILPDNAPMTIGDILVWTLTTMHVGYQKKIKFLSSNKSIARGSIAIFGRKYFFNNLIHKYLPSFMTLPKGKERMIIHAVYGRTESAHTKRYIEYCKRRLYAVNRWDKTTYSEELKQEISESGILFLDMTEYCSDELVKNAGTHFQLPY